MLPSKCGIPHIDTGTGRIVLRLHGALPVFSELCSTYPLKLLSPRVGHSEGVAIVYVLTYGGGLVGGDTIQLAIDVGPSGKLVLLTQGSTKVFKTRPGDRAARPREPHEAKYLSSVSVTTQTTDVIISENGALFLLPDPVTCFRSASYTQTQTFRLSRDASVVALDWVTSGRIALGEEWVFSRYYSANQVWVDGELITKDVMLLSEDGDRMRRVLPRRSLLDRLSPYSCYATLILYGSMVKSVIREMTIEYEGTTVQKATNPPPLIWSLSPISDGGGCIVRVAGKETELVRNRIAGLLRGLEGIIGVDMYRKAFHE